MHANLIKQALEGNSQILPETAIVLYMYTGYDCSLQLSILEWPRTFYFQGCTYTNVYIMYTICNM